jgi:hypothetical protein
VEDVATGVLTLTAEPDLRIAARLHIGWALIWSNRHDDALATLISVAEEASTRLPVTAWDAIGLAATVAYQTGNPAGRRQLLTSLDRGAEDCASLSRPRSWPSQDCSYQLARWHRPERPPVPLLAAPSPASCWSMAPGQTAPAGTRVVSRLQRDGYTVYVPPNPLQPRRP